MLPFYDRIMKAGGWNRSGLTTAEIVEIVQAGWTDPAGAVEKES
jgi:hypothetical protein